MSTDSSDSVSITIPDWTPPWPVSGDDSFVRVTAANVRGNSAWECPAQIAYKARPTVRVQRDPSVRIAYPPTETFALGIVKDAIARALTRGEDPDAALDAVVLDCRNPVPPAMLQVIGQCVRGYFEALGQLRTEGHLPADTVVRDFFAYDEMPGQSPERVEWSGWGVMHVSRDSELREYHVLTWDRAGMRERPEPYLAVYARIAADAVALPDNTPWWERWTPAEHQPRPGRFVRIREIGLLDSSHHLLHENSVESSRASFPGIVGPTLTVLGGETYNPGTRCATCAVRFECPGIARLPGLLGVTGESTWTRALTPADLTAAMACTWRVHLTRDLGLPAAHRPTTPAMVRGSSVHAWLEQAHSRLIPCSADDLPIPGDGIGEVAERLGWDVDLYAGARTYLLQHLHACPLRDPSVSAAFPEWSMTAWDTDIDVVVSTRPDLVVDFGNRVVVRETKSVGEALATDDADELFARYPQVALALCMLADGLDPVSGHMADHPKPAAVELELLSPDDCTVLSFDARDPETVLTARITVAEAVDRIVCEEPFPEPGYWCRWCPVAQWCGARQEAATGEGAEADQLSDDIPAGSRGRVRLLALSETPVSDDDDIPF